jgi:hypothetical protein
MSIWSAVALGVVIIAALFAVIKSRSSNVTKLHIDH